LSGANPFPATLTSLHTPQSFFFYKESLIAFILYRIWRWTAAPEIIQVASLFRTGQSLPSPSYLQTYHMKSATSPHHFSSSHICSYDRPLPSPTQGHPNRYAASYGVHPSYTHHGSSDFPISYSHCCWGPLPVPHKMLLICMSARGWEMGRGGRES